MEEELAKPLELFGECFREVETRLIQIDTSLQGTIPEIKSHLKDLNGFVKSYSDRLTKQETICDETRKTISKAFVEAGENRKALSDSLRQSETEREKMGRDFVQSLSTHHTDNNSSWSPKMLIAVFAVVQVVVSGLFAIVLTLLHAS